MVPTYPERNDYKKPIIVVACLLGAAMSAYLLYRDFNQSGRAGRGPPMARVERREANVRRRAASSFAWTAVQQDEPLFRKDSLQTSVGSAATVRFNDGNVLELGENSLVVIDDIQHLSLDFLKGSVVLRTAEGDKRFTVGSDGRAKLEELPIRLIRPEPLARYYAAEGETKTVRFSWKARAGNEQALASGLALQVSPGVGFRDARARTVALKDGSLDTELSLPPGDYVWRLVSGDRALTEPVRFRVMTATALTPVWPTGGERIQSYGETTPVQFRWLQAASSPGGDGGIHELEVSHDPEFKSVLFARSVAAASGLATIENLPDGNLYWRLRSRYGDISMTSVTSMMNVGKAQRPTLRLVQPSPKQILEKLPQVRFNWTSDGQGLQYRWELETGAGVAVASAQSEFTNHVWQTPAPGTYRWRVVALHKGRAVGESEWRPFSVFEGARIALLAPAAGVDLRFWDTAPSVVFQWKPDEMMQRHRGFAYQVQVATDPEFAGAVSSAPTKEVSVDGESLKLPAGELLWRVLIVDGAGQIVKASEPSRFFFGPFPELRAPEALLPQAGTVFNVLQKEEEPVLTWSEMKEAEQYEVTVYAAPAGRSIASASDGRVIRRVIVTEPTLELKGLKPASYAWSVRAIDRLNRKGEPTEPVPFSVTYGEVLKSPQIISPEVQ